MPFDCTDSKVEVRDFGGGLLLEKKFAIEANLKRRHLNDFQMLHLT